MTITALRLIARHIKPQPRVLPAEQIQMAALLRSMFWAGEQGDGEQNWLTDAEFEQFLNDQRESSLVQ